MLELPIIDRLGRKETREDGADDDDDSIARQTTWFVYFSSPCLLGQLLKRVVADSTQPPA